MSRESARRFAAALDAENYETVRASLAAGCVYEAPEEMLVGPEAIVASYRENAVAARGRAQVRHVRAAARLGDRKC